MQNTENDGIKPTQLYRLADEEKDALVKCVAVAKQYESLFGLNEAILIRIARNLGNPYKDAIAPPGTFTRPVEPPPAPVAPAKTEPVAPVPPPNIEQSLVLAKMQNAFDALKHNVDNELTRAQSQETKDVLTRLRSNLNVVL